MEDPAHDERLTAVGLLFEASSGLADELARRLSASTGLPHQAFEILLRLRRSPERRLRMTDLAAQVMLTPSGLTRAVDRLAGAGLVERQTCPTDRRVAYAVLTPAGSTVLDDALPGHLADIDELVVGVLEPDELEALEAALRRLRDHLRPTAAQVTPTPTSTSPQA